ncbi:MAG TPA: hypothetical protein VFM43_05795 [Gaiellaceae bacterium]|nr:hypothetical protein [Gaiellaceae bacterium]
MKRKTLLALGAAASIAAIVVLTTTAFAGTGGGRPAQRGDSSDPFVACLAAHGVQVPSDDPAMVKQWLSQHSQDDPKVQAALAACSDNGTGGTDSAPADLIACLEQHRVDVPSDVKQDPGAFKQWLVGAMDQPAVRSAVDDCTSGPPPSGQKK